MRRLVAPLLGVVLAAVTATLAWPGSVHRELRPPPGRQSLPVSPRLLRAAPDGAIPPPVRPRPGPSGGAPVTVAIAERPTGPRVPRDFLGLSFETSALPTVARGAARGNLAALLRTLGAGVLRFGGVSADRRGAGAAFTPAALRGLAGLARRTGWRVLLTVGLGRHAPGVAAQQVARARAALGPSLMGVEIGNEPDTYASRRLRRRGDWRFARYSRQVDAYRRAIEAAAPGTPVAGPGASSGATQLPWVRAEAAAQRPALLTDHFYPSSSCGYTPPLSDLVSPVTRGAETWMLRRLRAISRASGIPLRVDETNNVSCKGQPGVSDTFASALWALDYIARAMTAGVAGLNFHVLLSLPRSYTPLAAEGAPARSGGRLQPNPEWYALMAARVLPGSRPVPAHTSRLHPQLTAAAFGRGRRMLHVVLVDEEPPGAPPLAVHLRVARRFWLGSVLRLTAPSPASAAGVRLGGRRVSARGMWRPSPRGAALSGRRGDLVVRMRPASAAVVTLQAG